MSVWRTRARARIAELVKDLPADASLADRRKALRGMGWRGGWAQKVWHQECSAYLQRHGAEPRGRTAPLFPDHVHFPFRESGHASSSGREAGTQSQPVGGRSPASSSAAAGGKYA